MFHSPQSNADDHSLICPPHPVRKFSGFHFRRFLIPLLLLASCGLLQTLLADEIIGRLGTFKNNEGDEYFGISVETLLVMKTADGQMLQSVYPQLAGLDQKAYDQARQWTGRRVRVTGKPMERHSMHHATPVLWLADKITLEKEFEPIKPEGGFVSERINLFGVPTDLMIQQQIYETVRTWSQVREITLEYLDAQPQDKPSLREAEKRLEDIQGKLARKYRTEVEALAAKRGESIWDTAAIFQGAEGSAIAPKTQDTSDILNGLYQIQTALELQNEKN
jgi:hypothetical protein